jgi:hypothetical protein
MFNNEQQIMHLPHPTVPQQCRKHNNEENEWVGVSASSAVNPGLNAYVE